MRQPEAFMTPNRLLVCAGLAAALLLTTVDAVLAQVPAPNRKDAIIKDILPKCPQAFANAPVKDPHRRQVIPFVVAELNKIDGGNWAVLYRLDRQDETPEHGRLTVDVAVWKPTKEHFDVLSDKGGMWKGHGPITDPDWLMRDPSEFPTICGSIAPPPPVTPPAPPPTSVDVVEKLIADLKALLASQHRDLVTRFDALELQVIPTLTGIGQQLQEHAESAPTPAPPVVIPCLRGRVVGQSVTLCPVAP